MFGFGIKEYIIIAIFVALVASGAKLYHDGEKNAKTAIEAASLKKATVVKEKQDEIRNNRPDDAALIERLRKHTF